MNCSGVFWNTSKGRSSGFTPRRKPQVQLTLDVLLATDVGGDYERYVEFFERVREDAVVRKGMLRIEL